MYWGYCWNYSLTKQNQPFNFLKVKTCFFFVVLILFLIQSSVIQKVFHRGKKNIIKLTRYLWDQVSVTTEDEEILLNQTSLRNWNVKL